MADGIPVERLLRLLHHATEGMTKDSFEYACGEGGWYGRLDFDPDIEDLATIARIISGERWQCYPERLNDGPEADDGQS